MEADFASPQHEWWPRPSDGRLVPLVLQTSEEPHLLTETLRWTRIGKVTSRVSPILRVSYWIGSSLFVPGTRKYRINIQSQALAVVKLLLAWPLLCILMFWTGYHGLPRLEALNAQNLGTLDSMSRYDTIHVQHGEDADLKHYPGGRNGPSQDLHSSAEPSEADSGIGSGQQYQDNIRLTEASTSSAVLGASSNSERAGDDIPASVRPRYLCFVKDFEAGTYEIVKVSDYLKQNGDDVDLEFVFVSYTRMQFRVATEVEIAKFTYPDEATREANRELARRDRELLARWGMDAAKNVGKRAFWLDFECVRNDDGIARSTSSSEDVYRICDIVRAAHSMIIAIGPTTNDKVASILAGEESPAYSREYVTPWLRQWGSRLWTLPELLLCPAEYRIRLYVVGDPSEPKAMAKRNFAERAWDDAEAVKELVNHFEGSAILTSQHLIEAALNCFSRRQTDQFSQGDIAYATMGLFPNRHRPCVNKDDSGFQAFAKLSLANDSGAFLERLICLAPRPGAPWHQTEDRWGVKLSDIHPNNKVYGVLGSDVILLDGVFGATIQWDDLQPEPVIDRKSGKFLRFWILMTFSLCLVIPLAIALFYCAIVLTAFLFTTASPFSAPVDALAIILGCGLLLMAIMAMLAPVVLITSRWKPRQPFKARLIGIEGTVDVGTVEKHLWGFNHGNLVDTTPSSYRDVDETNRSAPSRLSAGEDEFAFTLVDTYLMTVTHCRSNLPPTAMLICGQDSGMQRTLLCSYDWRTQTFHRQTVLRVSRQGLDQLHRVDRIRFSLASHPNPDCSPNSGLTSGLERQPSSVRPTGRAVPQRAWRTWKRELWFFAICLFTMNLRDPYITSFRVSGLGTQIYSFSWVISQLLWVGLVSRLPLSQVFPPILVARQFLPVLNRAFQARFVYSVLYGLIDGFFTLTLIAYTLCWYRAEELALRFLLWNLITSQCFQLLAALKVQVFSIAGYGASMILFFFLQASGKHDLVGLPREVSWLSAEQKVMYSNMAAAQRIMTNTGGVVWRQQRSFLIRYAQPMVVFVVSFLHTISTGLVFMNFRYPDLQTARITLVLLLLAVLVGLVLCRFPPASFYLMVTFATAASLIQILGLLGHLQHKGIILSVLLKSSAIVPPLLWSVVVQQASTWLEALGTVALAISGQAAAYTLLSCTKQDATENWGIAAYIPVLLAQTTFWVLLWACLRVNTRRVKLPINGQAASIAQQS